MPALIEALIDKQDVSEIIRDQIAALLVLESERQQVLATAANKDPALWALQVFLERSDPWSMYQDHPETVTPVISVSLQANAFDKARSDIVQTQGCTGAFHVDCYGYGKASDVAGGGHMPGDEKAAMECQRAVRLVRNILMSAHYAYLGLPRKTVEQRWIRDATFLTPPIGDKPTVHVVAGRVTLDVMFREQSPQVQGVPFELLFASIKRASDGRLYFAAQYGDDS